MARKKKKTTFFMLVGVLVLLLLLYSLVLQKKQKDEKADSESDAITLTAISSDRIENISFTMNGTTQTYSKKNDIWVDQEDLNAPIDQDKITNMLSNISSVAADKVVVENPEDLAEYGLKEPAISITVVDADTNTTTIDLGDSLGVGTGYYALIEGSNVVYAVGNALYAAFNYTESQLYAIEEFPTITTTNCTDINLVQNEKNIFAATYDEKAADAGEYYAWNITKPYETVQKGDPTAFDTYFENYGSVSFGECVAYDCKDLAKYGLDQPSAVIDLSYYTETTEGSDATTDTSETTDTQGSTSDTTNDTTTANTEATKDSESSEEASEDVATIRTDYALTLRIGDKNEAGEYYVQLQAQDRTYENAVYTLSATTVDAMLTITPYDYVNKLVQLVDITTLNTLTVKSDGSTYEFSTEGSGDDVTYYYNKNKVDEDSFKNIYQVLIGISTTGEIKKDVQNQTPVYTFDFTRNADNLENLHVEYLPYDDVNFYRVSINGEEDFLVEKAAVDSVMKQIEEYQGTEE